MLKALARFCSGYLVYRRTGRTPTPAYFAMRQLHARTDGRFNDVWLWFARVLRPHRPSPVQGFLGDWTAVQLQQLAAQLERDGIAVLERRLPEPRCAELETYARRTPSLPLGRTDRELYRSETASALRYDFDPASLKREPLAADLAFDGTCAAIAGAYFRSRPVFDFLTMWWTTGRGARDLSGAAQQFHYDMDRLFFLKFFVYLTDVEADNGPHVYVAGSHRRKPASLREDRRFSDAEVAAAYPAERIRHITGPRGTVFVADTRGLHKGEPVRTGERLVLQVEYALNRFGQNY